MEFLIRNEKQSDYYQTEDMLRRATYNRYQPGSELALHLHELRTDSRYLPRASFLACVGEEIIGGIFLKKAESGASVELLEVLPGYAGAGAREALLDAAREAVTDMGGALEVTDVRVTGLYDHKKLGLFERKFDAIPVAYMPLAMGYEDAGEQTDGYHLEWAEAHTKDFCRLFEAYVKELAAFDEELFTLDATAICESILGNERKYAYVAFCGERPAGILVLSVAEETESSYYAGGCNQYLEEIFVLPQFRKRGIGRDMFLRFFRQQKGLSGYNVIGQNRYADQTWKELLSENGFSLQKRPAAKGRYSYRVRKN